MLRDVVFDMQLEMVKFNIQLFFIFGKSEFPEKEEFKDELEKENDIIIGDFFDSWETLFLKTWTGHRFIQSEYFRNCSEIDWIIFQDDDAFVEYPLVSKTAFVRLFF